MPKTTLGPVNETNMTRIWNKHKLSATLKKKVLVLMSGGVDSSVAALLLKKQGYQVSGVYLKLWEGKKGLGDPCWVNEKRDAEKTAAKLGVPFFVLDVTCEYQKRVMDYFFKEYAAGRTPNPDVMCNQEIKFGFVLEKALSLRFNYVATGHYAAIKPYSRKSFKAPMALRLFTAKDKNKDQSYFLWTLTQKQLARILFPIGNYTKPQVRELAKKFNLPTWNKKDSQGICFLGKVKVMDFLKRKIKSKAGDIIDLKGRKIGKHEGIWFYTIGQRAGLNIGGADGPYYVYQKNTAKNQLTVVSQKQEKALDKREALITNLHWIASAPKSGEILQARARYRTPLIKTTIKKTKQKYVWQVNFFKPIRALTSGQSVVFYRRGQCLGGGIIQ